MGRDGESSISLAESKELEEAKATFLKEALTSGGITRTEERVLRYLLDPNDEDNPIHYQRDVLDAASILYGKAASYCKSKCRSLNIPEGEGAEFALIT